MQPTRSCRYSQFQPEDRVTIASLGGKSLAWIKRMWATPCTGRFARYALLRCP